MNPHDEYVTMETFQHAIEAHREIEKSDERASTLKHRLWTNTPNAGWTICCYSVSMSLRRKFKIARNQNYSWAIERVADGVVIAAAA